MKFPSTPDLLSLVFRNYPSDKVITSGDVATRILPDLDKIGKGLTSVTNNFNSFYNSYTTIGATATLTATQIGYGDGANLLTSDAGLTYDSTTKLITNTGGLVINQGTITTPAKPLINHTATWNDVTVVQKGIVMNITDSASNFTSSLIDIKVGGSQKFLLDKWGNISNTGVWSLNTSMGIFSLWSASNTSSLYIHNSITDPNTDPIFSLTSTWNTTAIANGILYDVTDTASAVGSALLNLKVNTITMFSVDKSGAIIGTDATLSTNLNLGVSSSIDGQIVLKTAANNFTTTIKTGVTGASYTLTLPTTDGNSGEFCQTNGSGVLTWALPSTIASVSTIVDDTTTNATMYPLWVTANNGNLPLKVSSTKLNFNPSTGYFGIGVVATTSLHVKLATACGIQVDTGVVNTVIASNDGSSQGNIGTSTNHAFAFYTNASEKAQININGGFVFENNIYLKNTVSNTNYWKITLVSGVLTATDTGSATIPTTA